MPRARKSLPRYLKHSSGKGRIVWTDLAGVRHERLLPGAFDSAESREAFARLQLELTVSPAAAPTVSTGPTVVEVLLPYLKHAAAYYGDTPKELGCVKYALKAVRELYGQTAAADFGPRALAAVRESFVRQGWSRPYCNAQVRRVVRAFKWAAGEEIVGAPLYAALRTLAPLRAGKTDAPETIPRLPADPTVVDATLPFLPPHVRAIVELLRLTGMRPSEACRMTLGRIDRTGDVWVYSPKKHKTAHRGKGRTILLGPTAQAVIVAHLGATAPGPDEPLFSPFRQRDERFLELRAKRKTKVPPSQMARKKAKPKRVPGEWFTYHVLGHAVNVAARKAGVVEWSPYQLRHLVGAELREKFSLEHVRAALGHSHASMSAHYAKGADRVLAAEVASRVG